MEEVRDHEIKKYPGFEKLLAKKEARRKRLAELSFKEKIAIVNKWRRLSRQVRKTQLTRGSIIVKGSKNG